MSEEIEKLKDKIINLQAITIEFQDLTIASLREYCHILEDKIELLKGEKIKN